MRVHRVEVQKSVSVSLLRGSMQWNIENKRFQWFDFRNTLRLISMVYVRISELNRMYIVV